MRWVVKLGVLGILLISCAGCGQQAKTREMVRGHVLYRGATLSGGTIVFTPDAELGGDGPLATAEIKTDGSYSLKTENADGATSGHYRVTIASDAMFTNEQTQASVQLPRRYCDPAQAGLKREVKANMANTIDFNLE